MSIINNVKKEQNLTIKFFCAKNILINEMFIKKISQLIQWFLSFDYFLTFKLIGNKNSSILIHQLIKQYKLLLNKTDVKIAKYNLFLKNQKETTKGDYNVFIFSKKDNKNSDFLCLYNKIKFEFTTLKFTF